MTNIAPDTPTSPATSATSDIYRLADLAAGRIINKSKSLFVDWIAVGIGWMHAREEVVNRLRRGTGTRSNSSADILKSQPYRNGIEEWLKLRAPAVRGLLSDAPLRSNLTRVMEHREEIEAWRATLKPKHFAAYNHPTTIWHAYKKATTPAEPELLGEARPPTVHDRVRMLERELEEKQTLIEELEAGNPRRVRDVDEFRIAIRDECNDEDIKLLIHALAELLGLKTKLTERRETP